MFLIKLHASNGDEVGMGTDELKYPDILGLSQRKVIIWTKITL